MSPHRWTKSTFSSANILREGRKKPYTNKKRYKYREFFICSIAFYLEVSWENLKLLLSDVLWQRLSKYGLLTSIISMGIDITWELAGNAHSWALLPPNPPTHGLETLRLAFRNLCFQSPLVNLLYANVWEPLFHRITFGFHPPFFCRYYCYERPWATDSWQISGALRYPSLLTFCWLGFGWKGNISQQKLSFFMWWVKSQNRSPGIGVLYTSFFFSEIDYRLKGKWEKCTGRSHVPLVQLLPIDNILTDCTSVMTKKWTFIQSPKLMQIPPAPNALILYLFVLIACVHSHDHHQARYLHGAKVFSFDEVQFMSFLFLELTYHVRSKTSPGPRSC